MNNAFEILEINPNVSLTIPTDKPKASKLPVFLSRTDGTLYPLSQVKSIEHDTVTDRYHLIWDGATAKLSADIYDRCLKPYIEIVNYH